MVWNLLACTVDDVSDLVRNYEFDVLGSEFVTNEESIFDLDGSDHIWVELVLLLS